MLIFVAPATGPDQIIPLFPVNVIFPDVSKSIARVLALFDENTAILKVFEPKIKVPAVRVNVPDMVKLLPKVSVKVALFKVTVVAVAPAAVVQVPVPEFASNIAVSAATGADAPAAPPDVVDQFAVLAASQVPVPPTQYRVAIFDFPYG
jgi:hypothetical protein